MMKWKNLDLSTIGGRLVPRVFAALLACVLFAALLSGQDRLPTYGKFAWDVGIAGERGVATRYGNWYGPGWWGGSEDPKRVGMLPPIDALDKIAQKHDFGYQVAEEIGKGRPEIVAYYKAMADGIAVRDAKALPTDPARWVPPPKNIELARRYRDRIAVGFGDLVKNWNALLASYPTKPLDPTDPDEIEMILAGPITDKAFEARALSLVRDWEKKHKQWLIEKAAKTPVTPKRTAKDWTGEWLIAWDGYGPGAQPVRRLIISGEGVQLSAKEGYVLMEGIWDLTTVSFDGTTLILEDAGGRSGMRERWEAHFVGEQLKGTLQNLARGPAKVTWVGTRRGK